MGSANPHLYGFKPANLVGCTLSHFVDALEPYASTLPELVTAMVTKAAEKPGLSWRVGIHPPWEPGCSGMSVTQVSNSRPLVGPGRCCRASAARCRDTFVSAVYVALELCVQVVAQAKAQAYMHK